MNSKLLTMIEANVKENLSELRTAISRADGDAIRESLRELDRLAAEHKAQLDPQLLHFLQRRSYDKAWMLLGGEKDIPPGVCGGRG